MRRLIRSRLIWIPLFANVCPILHDVQRYLTLPFSFIPGIYLTIIMAMIAMSVMFSVLVIIISFQIFTLP